MTVCHYAFRLSCFRTVWNLAPPVFQWRKVCAGVRAPFWARLLLLLPSPAHSAAHETARVKAPRLLEPAAREVQARAGDCVTLLSGCCLTSCRWCGSCARGCPGNRPAPIRCCSAPSPRWRAWRWNCGEGQWAELSSYTLLYMLRLHRRE